MSKSEAKDDKNAKINDLAKSREDGADEYLTSNQGLPINDDQNSLKAGIRGPSLLEDFLLREKITHFDHERIPERIVHARGTAAHGYFQVYKSLAPYTKAGFLQDPSVKTPVVVRFSTVVGSRGSSDLARDVRGFAVKFYTGEGNYDLVGNNIPVFENVAHLDQLPSTGIYVIALPMKIQGGSGGPLRIVAWVNK
jgi:catalase